MSRTYQALKKAERLKRADGQRTNTNGSVGQGTVGRRPPTMLWELDERTRLEYERIQVWITNCTHPDGVRTLMVAAPHGGSGTTTTATRLAATLADLPLGQVLIVDANLRTPAIDLVFGTPNTTGLTELLAGDTGADPVRRTGHPNLCVLTTGRIFRSPAELVDGAAIERVITQLKCRFKYIVFDVAPLLQFPDAYPIAQHVDAVLLVVEADRTTVEDAQRATRDLERAGARPLGVVLNRHRDYTPPLVRRFLELTKLQRPT
jgi:capsular exopolysaccharide synthesis family protein